MYRTLFSALLITLSLLSFTGCKKKIELGHFEFGGDFTLTDTNGAPFRLSSLKGETVLLFFGYTTCPDVCPTTLSKIKQALARPGIDPGKVKTVFITVDPDRDSKQKLKEYLSYFEIPIYGLTGTKQEIDAVVSQYKGAYMKKGLGAGSELGYLIEHTSYIYLIDQSGDVRYLFAHDATPELINEGIQALQHR